MAIEQRTAVQYARDIADSILERDPTVDVEMGPIPDLVIRPVARVAAHQNARLRRIQDLILLVSTGSYTDDELEAFVANEGLTRLPGSGSTVDLVFYRSAAPDIAYTVQAGHPVSTMADEETGAYVTFVTTESRTLPAGTASAAYYNANERRYELRVPAASIAVGGHTRVGPGRITRSARPLIGFDGVTNVDRATGGRDRETNQQLINRYVISLMGTTPAGVYGISKQIMARFPSVTDHLIIYGRDPRLTRAASDAGAVDVYVIGAGEAAKYDRRTFVGVGQKIYLSSCPVVGISSVRLSTNSSVEYTLGVDFEVGTDDPGVSGSVRAKDYIVFLPTASALPAPGDRIDIRYTQNSLIADMQAQWSSSPNVVPGQDILFRAATKKDVVLSASVKVATGFSTSTIMDMVRLAIVRHVNGLKLGSPVELSDIHGVVRRISGVDNLVVSELHFVGGSGVADLEVQPNEYARLELSDLTLTSA